MPDTIVRRANLRDLPLLLEFEQRLIEAERPMDPTIKRSPISYYDISQFIEEEESEVFVVEVNGDIAASGYARIKDDKPYLRHEKQGYLGFMFVDEKHRGKGLNKIIIDQLLQWCKEKGVYEIRLDVYDTNLPAIRAYEKVGFEKHLINMRLNLKPGNDIL